MGTSTIIPTIGRPAQLDAALASLGRCRPGADEIVVVDQSDGTGVAEVVQRWAGIGARRVPEPGRGISRARNAGLRAARHDVVLITNDDCTTAEDWVAVALRELAAIPDGIVTGSVLPGGDPARVPSLNDDPRPRDYTGTLQDGVLYGANMAARRDLLLAAGGFDERITPSAEDNDLCYRWLRAGAPLRYAPAMRIWHHDWRTPAQMRALYRDYGVGQGVFYAKHLLAGDRTMLRFLARDLRLAVPAAYASVRERHRVPDWAAGPLLGLPVGLWRGLRLFGPGLLPGRGGDAWPPAAAAGASSAPSRASDGSRS
jgi:GT2 family glycosyltransferase